MTITDRDGAFLADAGALDLSCSGTRLSVEAADTLPERIGVLDCTDAVWHPARIVWRRADAVGVRFTGAARPASRSEIRRLTGRYYALGAF